ncbi:hypothetical protein LXA39_17680, partial [Erwinia amylovora]|uniref:hypothetical protein n=1 Tax=Erwinia amylovora TaxID=552 RepID=UPI0020BEA9C7
LLRHWLGGLLFYKFFFLVCAFTRFFIYVGLFFFVGLVFWGFLLWPGGFGFFLPNFLGLLILFSFNIF